jgi:hypothetical protein
MARSRGGGSFTIGGKAADARAIGEAKALAAQSRGRRARALREADQLEAQAKRVGAAIRKATRKAEAPHVGTITVRPARVSGRRTSRNACLRFSSMFAQPASRPSHVGRDGLSSFHFKWTSRGQKPRAGQKNSHRYRRGEAVNHVRYILRDDAREVEDVGIVSNISTDPDDIASLFGAIEELEMAGGRDNANVYCKIVISLPHEIDAAARVRVLETVGAEMAEEGLPFCFAPHKPDPGGDARNYHAHGLFSLRPFEKNEDGTYSFAAAPSSDLNDASWIFHLREVAARAMNVEMERAKQKRRFTAHSKKTRGLDEPSERKKGPGAKDRERRADDLAAMKRERDLLDRYIGIGERIAAGTRAITERASVDHASILAGFRQRQAEAEAREAARRRVIDARDQTLRDAIEARTARTATPKPIGSSQSQPKAPSGGLRNQAGAVHAADAGRPADTDPIKGGPRKPEDLPFDPSHRDPRRGRGSER